MAEFKEKTEDDMRSLRAQISELQNQRTVIQAPVYFNYGLRHHWTSKQRIGTFDFDRGSSKGVPYNPYTGIFTVENEGLYLFYANMLRTSDTTSEFYIKVDGQTRCLVYSPEDDYRHGSSSSCSTVEYLTGTLFKKHIRKLFIENIYKKIYIKKNQRI